jgi:hypothetical protein
MNAPLFTCLLVLVQVHCQGGKDLPAADDGLDQWSTGIFIHEADFSGMYI